MNEEILIAGSGGQGVLSMGKILAYAGMTQGKEVCWMPSYGPEMRGGTANVTIIIGNERISSPILDKFDTVVILNQQSLDKFEASVKTGGRLFYDSSGLTRLPARTDIDVYHIPAYSAAIEMDNVKIFNTIVLGGLLKIVPLVEASYIEDALKKSLPVRSHSMIPLNMAAFNKGGLVVELIHSHR